MFALLFTLAAWWAWEHREQLLQQAVTRTLAHWKDQITTRALVVTAQGAISAEAIRFRDDKIEVSISQVKGDLLARTVSAQVVEVKLLTPENKSPWTSLAPPVDFALEQLNIAQLRVLRGEKLLSEFSAISGSFAHRAKAFVFTNAHMEIAACGDQCALNGTGSISSSPPFATQAKLVFHYPLLGHPLLLRGQATGDLFHLKVAGPRQSDIEWRSLKGNHSIDLTLLDPQPIWLNLNYTIDSLTQANLAEAGIRIPLPALDLKLTSTFQLGTHTGGPLKLSNRKPLSYDNGGLPFETAIANLKIEGESLSIQDLQIDQNGKGNVHYHYRSQALQAHLPVALLDPAKWHGATAELPKRWTGVVDLNVPSMQSPLERLTVQFKGHSDDLGDYLGAHETQVNATINGAIWTLEQAQIRASAPQAFVREVQVSANPQQATIKFTGLRPHQLPSTWRKKAPENLEKWIVQYAPHDLREALSLLDGQIKLDGDLNRQKFQQISAQVQGQSSTTISADFKKTAQFWQVKANVAGPGKTIALTTGLTESGDLVGRSDVSIRAASWSAEKLNAGAVELQGTLNPSGSSAQFQSAGKLASLGVGKAQLEQLTFALSGTRTADTISGSIDQFSTREKNLLARPWDLRLARPARFDYRQQQFAIDAASLTSSFGTAQMDTLRWLPEMLQATLSGVALDSRQLGEMFSVPETWRNVMGNAPLTGSATINLPFGADEQPDLANAKASGRFQLTPASALVQSATLDFTVEQLRARGQLEVRNAQQATLSAKINVPLVVQNNAFALGKDQALEVDANGQTDLGLFSTWIDNDVRLAGSLQVNLRVRGTMDKPITVGTVAGSDLRLQHPPSNLSLTGGNLRASLDGSGLTIDEWRMLQGSGTERGELKVLGRYTWGGSDNDAFQVTVRKLLLPISPDQRLVVSGQGNLKVRTASVHLDAKVIADQARLSLRQEKTQDFGDDVKIIRRASTATSATSPAQTGKRIAFTSDIEVDLGPDFRFSGEGIKGRLEGKVQLLASGANSLRSLGSVNIVEGNYARFGQSLKIERGILRFAGPIDNPSLDIEAVRPNLAVNVSVRVAGTAQSPKVRLESATAMSEAEKLSWLALGAPLGDTLGSEQSGTLASALAGMLADASGAESGITQSLGLTQLGMTKNDKGTNIVSVGKRLGDRLLVTYEQGLRGVWNILRVQLQLTKQLEVRVQAGTESSIDLLWVIPLQQ